MAVVRCPQCKLPMTEQEAQSGTCPACAAALTPLPTVPRSVPVETAPQSSRTAMQSLGYILLSIGVGLFAVAAWTAFRLIFRRLGDESPRVTWPLLLLVSGGWLLAFAGLLCADGFSSSVAKTPGQLKELARAHRLVIGFILWNFLLAGLTIFVALILDRRGDVAVSAFIVLAIAVVLSGFVGLKYVADLTERVIGPYYRVLFILLFVLALPVPILVITMLAILSAKSTRLMRRNHIRVGFLGPRISDIVTETGG